MDIKAYKKQFTYSYSLGAFPTIELLKSNKVCLKYILIHSSFENKEILSLINQLAAQNKVEIIHNDKLINKLSPKENCFIIGVFEKYEMKLDESTNHILLDNPSDMGNLGTIIRTSLGFGIKNIGIIKPGVDIFNPKVIRASMGAIFNVNIEYFASYEEYKNRFKKHIPYSFMLQAKNTLQDIKFTNNLSTLIFGNEATGLDQKYLTENSIIISHTKNIDSLNLPTAVGIAIYELTKQQSI
ncbi:MAG: TrmH family RNA methyltransferase [Bacilli bacterium]